MDSNSATRLSSSQAVRIVSKNFLINFAGALWQFALLIIGTRLVLESLGADSFGILSLVGGTIGYFLYLDIGIGETVIKKVSEETDSKEISRIVSNLFFFSLALGVLLALIVFLFAIFGVTFLFSFEPELTRSCIRVFIVIAAGLWILYPLNIFGKIFIGLQRLDVYNWLRVIFQTAILAAILAALKFSNSAEAAVAAITVVGIIWKLTALLILRRMYPKISVSVSHYDRALLRDLLRYKSFATVSQAGGHIVYQCDIYMLGILMNPLSVTIYSIANIIAVKIAEISGVLGTALFPMVSRFYGEGMHDTLRKSFIISLQLMMFVAVPAAVFIAAFSESILELWVGPRYMDSTAALKWLAAAWMFNALSTVSAFTLKAINRPDAEASRVIVVLVLNLILDFWFIQWWGVIGAVYATLIAQAAWLVTVTAAASRLVGAKPALVLFSLIKLAALGLLLSAIYLINFPTWLFFVPPVIHTIAFAGLGYLLVMDAEYKGYVINIMRLIRAGTK
ncbi:MAG: oligosaccharide flippase family protein [Nitrospinota bacterium]